MIIMAHAGTGKTTLAKMYPDKVLDFMASPYKYHSQPSDKCIDIEKVKASTMRVRNEKYPANYIEALKENMNSGKVLLISSCVMIRKLLQNEKIPYILCYPQRDAKDLYCKRYIDRGNTNDFLSLIVGNWDYFIDIHESDNWGKHIVMKPHEFLSDVLEESKLIDINEAITISKIYF